MGKRGFAAALSAVWLLSIGLAAARAEDAPPRTREGMADDPEAPGPDDGGPEDPGIKGKPNSEKRQPKLKAVK